MQIVQIIPKGFLLKWTCQYEDKEDTPAVLHRASMDLVAECMGIAERKLATLSAEFDRDLHELTSKMDTVSRGGLLSVLERDRNKVRLRMQNVKNRKLAVLRESSMGSRGDLPVYDSPPIEPHSAVLNHPGPGVLLSRNHMPSSQRSTKAY